MYVTAGLSIQLDCIFIVADEDRGPVYVELYFGIVLPAYPCNTYMKRCDTITVFAVDVSPALQQFLNNLSVTHKGRIV